MIVNVIVLSALLLAGLFVALWILNANLRRRIEEPKRHFQQQVDDYDEYVVANDAHMRRRK